MRLLFVLDRLSIGGAELHTMKLAAELTKRGFHVATVVLLAGGSSDFPVEDFPSPPVRLNGRTIASPALLRKFVSLVEKEAPDVVFSVNQSALLLSTVARHIGASIPRLVCIFHTTVISTIAGRLRLPAFRWCTSKADALIFVSRRQRDYWLSKGLCCRHVLAVQNGIDISRFRPPTSKDREATREKFGLKKNDFAVMLVARFAAEKNHTWLLNVLARMRAEAIQEIMNVRLVFVGEGPLRSRLAEQCHSLGLSSQVIFAGAYRDVAPLLAMGDAGILVSHSIETFSLAALELMASGMPMIMTDTGGAAEILTDDVAAKECLAGILIGVNDEDALRRALVHVTRPDAKPFMSAAARRRVVSRFTLEGMVNKYESFLRGSVDASKMGKH